MSMVPYAEVGELSHGLMVLVKGDVSVGGYGIDFEVLPSKCVEGVDGADGG